MTGLAALLALQADAEAAGVLVNETMLALNAFRVPLSYDLLDAEYELAYALSVDADGALDLARTPIDTWRCSCCGMGHAAIDWEGGCRCDIGTCRRCGAD